MSAVLPCGRTIVTAVEKTVADRLAGSSYLERRRIECVVHNGMLTLSGFVSSYYLRQVAQALARDIPGVDGVDNRIEVTPPPRRGKRGDT